MHHTYNSVLLELGHIMAYSHSIQVTIMTNDLVMYSTVSEGTPIDIATRTVTRKLAAHCRLLRRSAQPQSVSITDSDCQRQ